MVCDLMAGMFHAAGHDVRHVSDGRQAVDIYLRDWREIDLVVLDMVMPGLNGVDTFRALRRVNREVRVLLVSGFSVEGDARMLLDDGAAGFVQKPVNREVLLAACKAAAEFAPARPGA